MGDDRRTRGTSRLLGGCDGTTDVDVHHTVRDLKGDVLSDKVVGRVFRIEDGPITRFDIR